ncbi:MAG TPA: LysM peptidoglycan-binding domain-containing protein [Chloroflexota bacterium]|nr:LysM peptidoglycan-binding domain-containing protein [Chloroflexota bacterium]
MAALLAGSGAFVWTQAEWPVRAAGLPLPVVSDFVRRERPQYDAQPPRSAAHAPQLDTTIPARSNQQPVAAVVTTDTPATRANHASAPEPAPSAVPQPEPAVTGSNEPVSNVAVSEANAPNTGVPAPADEKPANTPPAVLAVEPTPTAIPMPTATLRPAATPTARPVWTATPSASVAARATHVIASGDTLSALARQYNTTVDAIARLNNLAEPNNLAVGTRLLIPK